MDLKILLEEELGINPNYVRILSDTRGLCLVHQQWLRQLQDSNFRSQFLCHPDLSDAECNLLLHQSPIQITEPWMTSLVVQIPKHPDQVYRFVDPQLSTSSQSTDLSFSQLMHYISETNYRNMWKDTWKRYQQESSEKKHRPRREFQMYVTAVREAIQRLYGCPVIRKPQSPEDPDAPLESEIHGVCHPNILPLYCAVETPDAFILFHHHVQYTLYDCVTFSPAVLGSSVRCLFTLYQLLHALRDVHDRGVFWGHVRLTDVAFSQGLWVQVIPQIWAELWNEAESIKVKLKDELLLAKTKKEFEKDTANDREKFLSELTEQWVKGKLSNFDYLMELNRLSGRVIGRPGHHPVLPWIMDFTIPEGGWRDLTKSKLRLNKGDRQLDLTYESTAQAGNTFSGCPAGSGVLSSAVQVPHHISEVLSDITYYVYKARCTPKSVLCRYVRPKWVPAEYPASMQRMQEWTPDECIPEFFTDPDIFLSQHSDLPDLEVPWWSSGTRDFLTKHRQALESDHVSERLHHWIDIVFGYKLSGNAALKSKNVCLPLVDQHSGLSSGGMVQLFQHLHPHRIACSLYLGRNAPKTFRSISQKTLLQSLKIKDQSEACDKELSTETKESGDEESSQSECSSKQQERKRNMIRSKFSINPINAQDPGKNEQRAEVQTIVLPKDYNPLAALQQVESLFNFSSSTTASIPSAKETQSKEEHRPRQQRKCQDMLALGCLVCQMTLPGRFHVMPQQAKLTQAYQLIIKILQAHSHELPKCVHQMVCLLLQVSLPPNGEKMTNSYINDSGSSSPFLHLYPSVTRDGLPPPSAHQLLQSLINVVPFPSYFKSLYVFLCKLNNFSNQARHIQTGDISQEERLELLNTLAEAKVSFVSRLLPTLLPLLDSEGVHLLAPYLQELFENKNTSLLAVWHLFCPVSQTLGPSQTCKRLLSTLTELLDPEEPSLKHLKLYHRSCLLQWIVRLGLGVFLAHFVTLLVEATGGFRDITQEGSPRSRDLSEGASRKGSHLHSPELEQLASEEDLGVAPEGTVSPYDDDSSQNDSPAKNDGNATDVEPEIFAFDAGDEMEQDGTKTIIPSSESETSTEVNSQEHEEVLWKPDDGLNDMDEIGGYEIGPDIEDVEVPAVCMDEGDPVYATSAPTLSAQWGLQNSISSADEAENDHLEDEVKKCSLDGQGGTNNGHIGFSSEKIPYNISDVASESVLWLAHRLGPVLTAKHLSRNLLRMLTLCYFGADQSTCLMQPPSAAKGSSLISLTGRWVSGDRNAGKVLDCLGNIAELYGENFIVLQFFPHAVELISFCKRRLTSTLEAGLVGVLALVQHIIPYLSDATLMDHLPDTIIKDIVYPAVRLVSTLRFTFPGGGNSRYVIASKILNILYIIGMRIGFEMTRKHLTCVLQRFFAAFDKAHENLVAVTKASSQGNSQSGTPQSMDDYLEIKKSSVGNDYVIGATIRFSAGHKASVDSLSPPAVEPKCSVNPAREQALEEVRTVFDPEMAYIAYVHFCKLAGGIHMEQTLKNDEVIRQLCIIYDMQTVDNSSGNGTQSDVTDSTKSAHKMHRRLPSKGQEDGLVSGEFGKYVALVGNRIDVNLGEEDIQHLPPGSSNMVTPSLESLAGQRMADVPLYDHSLLTRKMENTSRHLKGNWRAYWEHEIGRSEKDQHFDFKQIKLQQFVGHTGSIRAFHVLDNENSFLSGSKDKTVKLWSLRSSGDGSCPFTCQWTYPHHRKSVFSLSFLDSLRMVGSCDSTVHLWDPFLGVCIKQLDFSKGSPVTLLTAMPAPSTTFLVATTNSTVRFLDARTCRYMHEFKVSLGPSGLIRCLTVSPDGQWVAVGHSSGMISVLDVRTGLLFGSRTCHEGEILQLKAFSNRYFVSSSLDHSLAVWSAEDSKAKCNLRGPMEPVTCLNFYRGEVISGTTANRIGVHSSIEAQATYTSTRLRSDTFKGVLTSMALLPLNRLLLLGADNGNVSLLC